MKSILVVLATFCFISTIQADDCSDRFGSCDLFVKNGWCKTKADYSKIWCRRSCGFCSGGPVTDAPTTDAPPPQPTTCGKPEIKNQRVIAGTTARRGSWPWQILMLYNGRGSCGGAIVGPRHIVTAAHCVVGRTNYPGRFKVRVGEHNTFGHEGSEAEYQVKKVHAHPQYGRPSSANNDIAVFELEQPIRFSKYVSPVCLPDKNVAPGTECYITGWGKIKHPGSMTIILQQARMPVVSNEVCQKKNYPAIRIKVTDAMICSGDGGNTRKSGCHGDSGGPFVCQVNGRWELHGAVSHGSPRCKSSETYTVYARVAHFKQWIDGIMKN